MTMEQSLAEFKALYPEGTPKLHVSRDSHRGDYGGHLDSFYLWKNCEIVAHSNISFEHAISIAKSAMLIWEQDDSEIEATLAD